MDVRVAQDEDRDAVYALTHDCYVATCLMIFPKRHEAAYTKWLGFRTIAELSALSVLSTGPVVLMRGDAALPEVLSLPVGRAVAS